MWLLDERLPSDAALTIAFSAPRGTDIDWTDYFQAIPSLFCIILQPLTYKIEVGVLAGLLIYVYADM